MCHVEGYWDEFENRKQFFDSYAAERKFDPLIPENWYKITSEELMQATKVAPMIISPTDILPQGKVVLLYYNGMGDALQNIYPFLSWDKSKFSYVSSTL